MCMHALRAHCACTHLPNPPLELRSHGCTHVPPQVKVNGAFMWSVGSFDAAAVHPISTSAEGSFGDAEIARWMQDLSAAAAV